MTHRLCGGRSTQGRARRLLLALAAGLWLAVAPLRAQDLVADLGEQVLTLPSTGWTEPALEVTVYRPPGDGPFPLVLINHGRATGNAHLQPRYRPVLAARAFVQRGYAVVVPMRQGFSRSGGEEITAGCNVASNGLMQARSVHRTLAWLATQPWADVSRHVVMGQSHGGLTTLAYGTEPHPGTRLLVNFAGGLRQNDCTAWQTGLISAIAGYGQTSRLPALWFYGDNDSYFSPHVFRSAHAGFVAAGGRAELVAYGPFGGDSHAMFGSRAGLPIWLPRVLAAMAEVDLPVARLHAMDEPADQAPPPPSGFARVDDLDRLPLPSERGRAGYAAWLRAEPPRAFAIHPSLGHWASAWGGDRPVARALANCERLAKAPCRLYAVDEAVVWSPE